MVFVQKRVETEDFNSHARVGRDARRGAGWHRNSDFNSHARVGRDHMRKVNMLNYGISTHTPV